MQKEKEGIKATMKKTV